MITRDDWLKAINEAGIVEDDPTAVTINEFAAMFDMPWQRASRQLARLEKAGKAVRTKKFAPGSDGRQYYLVAYRLTKS